MAPSMATTPGYQDKQALATLERLASTASGLLVVQYSYHDIKRVMDVSDEGTAIPRRNAQSADTLGTILHAGLHALKHSERVGRFIVDVEPLDSVGTLFEATRESRELKPRLIVAYDMRRNADIVGCCTVCLWTRAEALGTERFTTQYLDNNNCPRLNGGWLLVDVIASSQPGSASLLLLHAYLAAMRARMAGVVAVCVTPKGSDVFTKQGFSHHSYRQGGAPRTLVWIHTGELRFEDVAARLRYGGGRRTTEELCFRLGLSAASAHKLQSRCPRA